MREDYRKKLRETAVLYFFQELKPKRNCRITSHQTFFVKYRIGRAKELFNERVGGEKKMKNYKQQIKEYKEEIEEKVCKG